MQIWNTFTEQKKLAGPVRRWLRDPRSLFLDIETTGLSPNYHFCYMIGCCHPQDEQIAVTQFFCDDPSEEEQMLREFLAFAAPFEQLVTFNGQHFDLPFLQKRCRAHDLPESLSAMRHLDIYRVCQSLKKPLHLVSCRQKAIERFLGIRREDAYGGGELIPVYVDYTKDRDHEKLRLLKLHNYEDVLGMIALLPMLSYCRIPENISITDLEVSVPEAASPGETGTEETDSGEPAPEGKPEVSELLIRGKLQVQLPVPIRLRDDDIYAILEEDAFRLSIRLVSGPLRYYLRDYRHYEYLTEEKRVVHKSLSRYVDASRKRPATAETCYLSQEGLFLPLAKTPFSAAADLYHFRRSYEDKQEFLLLDETTRDPAFLEQYITAFFLRYFRDAKKQGPSG